MCRNGEDNQSLSPLYRSSHVLSIVQDYAVVREKLSLKFSTSQYFILFVHLIGSCPTMISSYGRNASPWVSDLTTLNSPISVGGKFNVGHTNFLVMVKIMWVQDFGSSLEFSWRLPTNTLTFTKAIWNKINNHIIA